MWTCGTYFEELTLSVVGLLVILNCLESEAVRLIYQPMDHLAVEGKQAHVTCIFIDITDDMEGKYKVIWTKDSYIITEPSNGFDLDRFKFHNHYADRRHFVRINPVMREDGGGYRCHLRYNGEILLTSDIGILTIHEIPSDEYPLIKLGKPTYRTGEEVMVRCLCEKTNPVVELEWVSEQRQLLGPTTNSRKNNTHIWIEATVPAGSDLNGTSFVCQMTVEDEIAPRYSQSEELRIIDGLETTSKESSRQTYTQYMSVHFSTKYGSYGENDMNAKGGTHPIAYCLGITVTQSVCASVVLIAMVS